MLFNQEADEIAYRAAFACERQGYKMHTKKGDYDLQDKYTKTEIKKDAEKKGKQLDIDYSLEPYKIIEPEGIVAHTLDRMVAAVKSVDEEVGGTRIKCTKLNLWLSPSDGSNFRYSVANTIGPKGLGYKAGRAQKPFHLPFIRDRLLKKHKAIELFGFEADDALCMYQTDDSVASHIDKDIKMVPGWHYDHVKKELYHCANGIGTLEWVVTINEDGKKKSKLDGRGLIFFYAQLLMGDATDNIPGIPKVGPKKSHDILQGALACFENEEKAFFIVRQYYEATYGDVWQEVLEEVADLLWMCRTETETGRQYLKNRGFIT